MEQECSTTGRPARAGPAAPRFRGIPADLSSHFSDPGSASRNSEWQLSAKGRSPRNSVGLQAPQIRALGQVPSPMLGRKCSADLGVGGGASGTPRLCLNPMASRREGPNWSEGPSCFPFHSQYSLDLYIIPQRKTDCLKTYPTLTRGVSRILPQVRPPPSSSTFA